MANAVTATLPPSHDSIAPPVASGHSFVPVIDRGAAAGHHGKVRDAWLITSAGWQAPRSRPLICVFVVVARVIRIKVFYYKTVFKQRSAHAPAPTVAATITE